MSLRVPSTINDPHGEGKGPRSKRGRPRKDGNNPTEPPEERRRKQIRLAQRAHRQREKAALSRHEARIAQLETAIQKMHIAFSSFGEHLTNSGALVPHTALQAHLHDTFTTHKSLAEEAGVDPSPQSLQAESGMRTEPCLLSQLDGLSPPRLVDPAINSTSMPAVDMSVFIRHLRLASARYAVFLLRDSSVSLEGLRRKFRFLLSIMSREDLISYFEAALVATIHPERMVEWEELPFFRVGGAGTHFVHSRSWRYESHHPVWEDPLSKFPPDVQGEMDGRWYDIRDLQGFLQERAVHLCASPPASSNMTAVNVSALIKALVRTSICLGRSPGWRPLDVERAVRMSLWGQEDP